MGAGMYHIRVVGELDSTRIRAELDRISKSYRMMVGGGGVGGGATGKGKAGGGIVQLGKDAEQAKKKLQGLNGQVVQNEKKLCKFYIGMRCFCVSISCNSSACGTLQTSVLKEIFTP